MFTLRLFPKQPIIKFDRQLPISNWAYPFHREADLNADRLAPYSFPNRTQIRRRAIYIHIPFCETICNFCPFRRDKYKSASELDEYITALLPEPSKYWISKMIERQQQRGRNCENTDLTKLIYSAVGI